KMPRSKLKHRPMVGRSTVKPVDSCSWSGFFLNLSNSPFSKRTPFADRSSHAFLFFASDGRRSDLRHPVSAPTVLFCWTAGRRATLAALYFAKEGIQFIHVPAYVDLIAQLQRIFRHASTQLDRCQIGDPPGPHADILGT